MLRFQTRTVVAAAARTATGQSAAIQVDGAQGPCYPKRVSLLVDCTAASGTTPSMVVSVEWSMDGTNWANTDPTPDAFAAITAAKKCVKKFDVKAPFYRIVWTVTGTTPSLTFSVTEYADNN